MGRIDGIGAARIEKDGAAIIAAVAAPLDPLPPSVNPSSAVRKARSLSLRHLRNSLRLAQ
jgi:hypothetical protein